MGLTNQLGEKKEHYRSDQRIILKKDYSKTYSSEVQNAKTNNTA